jgi:hypothetical protein
MYLRIPFLWTAVVTIGAGFSNAVANEVDISLQLVTNQPVNVGDVVRIDLVLTSNKGAPQAFDALGAVLAWDDTKLQLIDNDQQFDSSSGLYFSGFLPDADLINESPEPLTPMDGDAYFQAFTVGQTFSAPVPPDGFIATSFLFEALAPSTGTPVQLVPTMGIFGETRVLLFGQDITGDIGGPVTIGIVGPTGACCTGSGCVVLSEADCASQGGFFYGPDAACPSCNDGSACTTDSCNPANGSCVNLATDCPPDVDPVAGGNDLVNVDDLVRVILSWGPCPPPPCCPGNTNGDGAVDVDDLVTVILGWGACAP